MAVVQSPTAFLNDFLHHAEQAKKRIYLQSMLFESGKALKSLEHVLVKKAQEGVQVHVTIDWMHQHSVHDDPNLFPKLSIQKRRYAKKIHQANRDMIKRWQDAGIIFTITNHPTPLTRFLPIANRNHTKMYVVDDVCWLGGINLFDLAFQWIDVMVRYDDAPMVNAVCQHLPEVNDHRPTKNYSIKTSHTDTLLIDAGIIGKSLILDEGMKAVKKATKSILFVSQFVPEGRMLSRLIRAAEKGIQVHVITSAKKYRTFSTFPYNIPYRMFLALTKNKPNIKLYHQHTKVHAKLLIIDDHLAIYGSHNMILTGVLLGTEEIAVKTKSKTLVRDLKTHIHKHTNLPQ